ncbi:hypothetical protein OF83DRAFT_1081787, partial [Amylostereum chailletii]
VFDERDCRPFKVQSTIGQLHPVLALPHILIRASGVSPQETSVDATAVTLNARDKSGYRCGGEGIAFQCLEGVEDTWWLACSRLGHSSCRLARPKLQSSTKRIFRSGPVETLNTGALSIYPLHPGGSTVPEKSHLVGTNYQIAVATVGVWAGRPYPSYSHDLPLV